MIHIEPYRIQQHIEIRIDGRLSLDGPMETGPKGQCIQIRRKLDRYLRKGYTKVKSYVSETGGRHILLNPDGTKAICISWRLHINKEDNRGNRIYNDSKMMRIANLSLNREFNEWHIARDRRFSDTRIYLETLIGQNPSGQDVWKAFPIRNSRFFDEFIVVK